MDRVLLACTVSLAIALAACNGRSGDAAEPETSEAAREAASYAQDEWVTIDGVDFPARMARVGPEIQEAYVFAAKHPEVLQYMPCYCGCEQEQPPHQSNVDCFVDQIDRSGERPRVTIDPMGFG